MADTVAVVTAADPSVAAIALQNRERLTTLEGRHGALDEKVDEVVSLVKELHADMVGRRAVVSIATRLGRWFAWALAGIGGLLGLNQSDAVIHWLKSFPTGTH